MPSGISASDIVGEVHCAHLLSRDIAYVKAYKNIKNLFSRINN